MRALLFIWFPLIWLSFSPLDGQIVSIEIDFNQDSIVDLFLWKDSYKVGSGCISVRSGDLFSVMPNDTIYLLYDSIGALYAFNYLDTVQESINCFESPYSCPDQSIYKCPFLIHHQIFWYDCDSTNSTITGLYGEVNNKYIGFKIKILDHYHYGWINFSKNAGVDFILRAYAYNTIPEEVIVIDDPFYTTIDRTNSSGLNIYPNPARELIVIDNINHEDLS